MRNITNQLHITRNIFLLVLFFSLTAVFPHRNSCALIGIKEGDIPKQIALEDLSGAKLDMAGLIGSKPVILVFWKLTKEREYLDYSLDELIFLRDFHDKYHDRAGLNIFGIYIPEEDRDLPDSEITAVQNLIKANRITFPILIDRGFKIFREYGVIALPSTIMIDKAGKIGFIYPSFPMSAQPVFTEQIMALLGVAMPGREEKNIKTKVPDTGSARFHHYAVQLYKRGMMEQAVSQLKKSIDLDPGSPWAHNLMGIIFSKRGNFASSAEEFKSAISLDKNNVPAYFNYGLLLFKNERYNEAEQQIKAAIALNSSVAEAHYVLGLVYKDTGRPDDALNELRTALSLFEKEKAVNLYDPMTFHRISTLYALSGLYARQGDDKKALALLQQAVRLALEIEAATDNKNFLKRAEELMMYE